MFSGLHANKCFLFQNNHAENLAGVCCPAEKNVKNSGVSQRADQEAWNTGVAGHPRRQRPCPEESQVPKLSVTGRKHLLRPWPHPTKTRLLCQKEHGGTALDAWENQAARTTPFAAAPM